ncbi:MAG: histidine phosphatase family protein [Pseudomonadota bacterium]
MKTLLLMRHAKSSWAEPGLSDFDRPLNRRGIEAAPRMAHWLEERRLIPDTILVSSAMRTRQTIDLMREAVPTLPEPSFEKRLYHAAPGEMLNTLARLPDTAKQVMLIGHEPGLSILTQQFAGGQADADCARAFSHFPTAAIAVLKFEIEEWSGIARQIGSFVSFAVPREQPAR